MCDLWWFKVCIRRTEGVTQVVEHLPSKYKALSSDHTKKVCIRNLGMRVAMGISLNSD
jgi:hypothetical protein